MPTAPQISVATKGGTGTPMLDISIEVGDLDAVLDRLNEAGWPLVHGRATEPWGVRRIFMRDLFDRLINILCHTE